MDAIIHNQYLPYLEEQKIIKKGVKEKIIKEAGLKKETLAATLVKGKYVSESDIEQFIIEKMGIQFANPMVLDIPNDVIQLVDKHTAQKYNVIPFFV